VRQNIFISMSIFGDHKIFVGLERGERRYNGEIDAIANVVKATEVVAVLRVEMLGQAKF